MLVMAVLGIVLFAVSRVKLKDVSFIFKMLIFFMVVNLVMIFVIAPEYGTEIYGSRHVLFTIYGRWIITAEQLFYEANIFLKYIMIVPSAILLIVTTNPSEFASSLNKIGISYYISFAFSLTLRYIPDVQRDYETIANAQQARGVELSSKTGLLKRLKGIAAILQPLIITSIERIDVISRAMEMRGFGKHKKRTWYRARPFSVHDKITLVASLLLFALGMYISFRTGSRFWNPFKG
jgi:energy-coupling factor transport system permease protein